MTKNVVLDTMFLLYDALNHKKAGRKLKCEFRDYYETVKYVLDTGVPWRKLGKRELHYTTYHKFFQKLISLNVFELTFKALACHCHNQNISEFKNLFIDSSMIKNINGKDLLGRNHYDRNRKGNKITVLVNSKGIPISIHLAKANIHDAKLIEDSIDVAAVKIVGSKLIGDKGYINHVVKRKIKRTKKISLIHPYRRNQVQRNTTFEKNLLKKRYIVEHFFSWIKKYRRIQQRYDSLYSTYLNFVYFGAICVISKKMFE